MLDGKLVVINNSDGSFTVILHDEFKITAMSLPEGVVGQAYSGQLTAQGGTAPYSWSATGRPPAWTHD